MPFVYLDSDQVFLDTVEVVFGEDPNPVAPTVGFEVYRNGDLEDIEWSRSQLLSISLSIVAYDGEIGTGQITVPGIPDQDAGWWIGDRISFIDPIAEKVLYTGYLMRPQISRNTDALTELQTTWQLMDINRLFIGRRVVQEWLAPFSLDSLVGGFQPLIEDDTLPPHPTVDDTTWVDTGSSPIFPAITYYSDGATDWIADIVKYTGKTVYLGLTDVENALELHVHPLFMGPTAGVSISESNPVGDAFAPSLNATMTLETSDLKDGVTGRNGVTEVSNTSSGIYENGGIAFEATVDYGEDEDTLVLVTNTVIETSLTPRPSYSFTIFHLIGDQVARMRAGSLVSVTSDVFNAAPPEATRLSRLTLSVTRDGSGNPLRGMWDVSGEIAFPLRGPTATIGFGGQGNQLGALATFKPWTHTIVTEDDPAVPVGSMETAVCQLLDDDEVSVPVPGVLINWLVVADVDGTDTPHADYETLDDDLAPATTSVTDASGQAHIVVSHITDTLPTTGHRVKAEP